MLLILSLCCCSEKELNFNLGIYSEFINKFNIREKLNTEEFTLFQGKYGGNILRLRKIGNISNDEADIYVSNSIFMVNSMYRYIKSPYPGTISNSIKCEERYKPKVINNFPYDYLILFASERLEYGVCSEEQVMYKSILAFEYCQPNTLFQIEFFTKFYGNITHYIEELNNITCENV